MDGVTDCAYREIVKEIGNVDLLYTEFQNVHGLSLGAKKLFENFRYTENQRFIVAQIYGHEIEYFYPATILCLLLGFNGVDINMGCPAKKISDRGAGAGLIQYPDTASAIIQEVKRARADFINLFQNKQNIKFDELLEELRKLEMYQGISYKTLKIKWKKLLTICNDLVTLWGVKSVLNSTLDNSYFEQITVSVKTRIGYDVPSLDNWILQILKNDIDFLAIHGRTLKQMYTGSANWSEISRGIKIARDNNYNIPIFANGDINSYTNYIDCINTTLANGVLIGRGSYGNPWLFKEIINKNNDLEYSTFDFSEVIQTMIKHSKYFESFKNGQFLQMRKVLGWYISSIPNAQEIRKKLYLTNNSTEVIDVLNSYGYTY